MEANRNMYASPVKLNKKENKMINQIQENIVRRILMVPQSTPIGPLYTESGLLDITTITTKNRINMEKRPLKQPNSMTTKVMNNNAKGGWKGTQLIHSKQTHKPQMK